MKKPHKITLFAAAALASSISLVTPSQASDEGTIINAMATPIKEASDAKIPMAKDEVSGHQVVVVKQGVVEFLRQAARHNNMRATISKKVRGVILDAQFPTDIRKIMPLLEKQFDLIWHVQQNQLFVSTGSENETRLVYLAGMGFNELNQGMKDVGMSPDSYDISYVEDSNSVLINGPASYIAGIELITASYNKNKKSKRGNIRVIRFGNVGN